MAEGVGFEPTGPCGPSVFKTEGMPKKTLNLRPGVQWVFNFLAFARTSPHHPAHGQTEEKTHP